MSSIARNCTACGTQFTVEPDDLSFYEKIGVQVPRMCPPCRAQLRLVFRNERVFYKRKCDKCGEEMVSIYSPNKPYPVWCYECWFAEDWDAADHGVDYDPGRPFFEQFKEVWDKVPKLGLIYVRSPGSEYLNISADSKNCYMIIESSNNEDSIHCYWIQVCRNNVDLSFSHNTEFSYESDDCYDCHKILYGRSCADCRDSYFLLDCRNCSDCIGCVNLRNAKYCVFNEQLTKEAYEKYLSEARLDTWSGVQALRQRFQEFALGQPRKYAEITNAPHSTGGYMYNVKNNRECFHSYDAEDCAHSVHVWRGAAQCVDCDTSGRGAELNFNSINAGLAASRTVATSLCWNSTDAQYSMYCLNSTNVFGSVGLRKKEYHILNKAYSKEEYERIREEIIRQMKEAGAYGEFFPKDLSAFGYNESCVQEQFPLTREEALAKGYQWEDHPRGTYDRETVRWASAADSIRDFETGDIGKEIFTCLECRKNYRVIPAEYQFYKRFEIPLPRLCPDCRHLRRFQARGPNRLFEPEQCACLAAEASAKEADYSLYENTAVHTHHPSGRCPNTFRSNYAPEHKELLYCEQCYNAEVA